MSHPEFETHLKDPAPAFLCYRCGDSTKKETFLARVKNRVHPPADKIASQQSTIFWA